ncbi:50S ribosome-binding GTPase [Nocardioides exalbidus]|uniref:50S ribosome-binding GTPase n=1 Tax=Nocardioides exalbidus TaxID=402596 RepID=A0A1H4JKN3_9ACTN|nr:YfjP family GTPase [Nocardioides exalbidus]SEB46208.1 50S ribosome-binding GTPase [Nocardioides exalbidus]
MTSLLEGAKKLVTRSSDIGARVDGLERAAAAARGRVDDAVVDDVTTVASRAASRLKLSADHTVVALAGATGSGKSSTFNALSGLELAAVGVRRPTTSWATAVVWGKEGAEELLEWLGIPARHQVTRDSMLSKADEDVEMRGVVLLDLPDHDSTEVSHHLEVERLVQLADMMVWVLDPQKYADAAIHDRFLKPLAGHADVMLVVLNHIDTVPEDRRATMVEDVRRLLEADGLAGVPVLPVSARQGWGIDELRGLVAKRVAEKKVTRSRLEADVKSAAQRLQDAAGAGKVPTLSKERVAALDDAFAEAAGIPTVVKAVGDSTRMRANRATGWPVTAWFSRLKPDPLKRLHLDLGSSGKQLTGAARTSVPKATGVQRARVDTEVRALADQVGEGMAPSWASAVRAASVSRLPDLGDRLDRAVGQTDLGAEKIPAWAGLVRVLQYLLIISAIVGALWLGVLALGTYARVPEPPTPSVGPFALPTLMLVGGIVLGLLLALVCRWLVAATARSRSRTADKRLRDAISEVSAEMVVAPIQAELASYTEVREGLAVALR